ncbi:serine/threonine-protein kinase [uncultured Microscilla sp.]|uniref:serine/threonine protein kinase n=1 Tax=uncultured Microscilla sp. TaxID=432653 RepID=UPI0026218FCC|nr:serine/threonine-protein kinase [uncultured Microscilla sp.]
MSQQQTGIGYYKIEKTLGTGGMGTVYLATHTQIGRQAAIKGLKPHLAKNPDIRMRFKNEAALMAKLHHPNIVDLYDYVELGENLFLVMEYVQGVTLEQYTSEISGPLSESQAKRVFAKILDAFAYAHQRGIVHRDIKPANIMITQMGDVKIMDFGIAKMVDNQEKNLTQAGVRLGTIYYMSPEQIRAWEIDARSDIFSLGITLFEILTGKLPYSEELGEYDLSQKIVNDPLPRLKEFLPAASSHMQKIIDKATAKDPDHRFQNAEQFKKALFDATLLGKQETEEEHLHQVVWNINQEQLVHPPNQHLQQVESSPANASMSSDTAEIENLPTAQPEKNADPIDQPGTESPQFKAEKEELLLKNYFGIVSTRRVQYFRNQDLFEKGKKERLFLSQVIDVEYNSRRELLAGSVFMLIAAGLFILGHVITYVLAISFLFFSIVCFSHFPSLTVVRKDGKKVKMKGWPWHLKQSKKFLVSLRSQLSKKKRF